MIVRASSVLALVAGVSTLGACNCCGDKAAEQKAQPAPAAAAASAPAAPATMSAQLATDADGNVPVVNGHCPIEPEDEIYQNKRKPNLVRIWNGQAVGFCCDGCMPEWDKLSPADKNAKLAAVMK